MAKTFLGNLTTFDYKSCEWLIFKGRLTQFLKINDVKEDNKSAILITHLSDDSYRLVRNLAYPQDLEVLDFKKLVELLDTHFKRKQCSFADKAKFYGAKRNTGESIGDWAARLRGLASYCEFGAALDTNLTDRFVLGLGSGPERDKLFEQDASALSLSRAVEIAERAECSREARKEISDTAFIKEEAVNKISCKGYKQRPSDGSGKRAGSDGGARASAREARASTSSRDREPSYEDFRCSVCGLKNHNKDKCRYKNYKCQKCGVQGHLKKVCDKKQKSGRVRVNKMDNNSDTDTEASCEECHNFNIRYVTDRPLCLEITVGNKIVTMELDSGSGASVMSKRLYLEMFSNYKLNDCKIKMCLYNGHKISPLGYFEVTVKYNNLKKEVKFFVVDSNGPPLLGRDFMSAFGLVLTNIYKISQDDEVNALLEQYPNLWRDELGYFNKFKVHLQLKENSVPKFFKARPIPFALKEKVESELNRLVGLGILVPVSNSQYATPIVPVLKDNGTVKIAGDFSVTLNKDLIIDKYPLPRIEEVFAKLGGGEHYSKIDLKNAYNQFSLSEDSQELTTINTSKGLFKYTRLVYGLANAPAVFQKAMEVLLSGIEGVSIWLDDICLTAPTKRLHLARLAQVLSRLDEAGLRLQKDKCEFFKENVTYLGYVIDRNGLRTSRDKVKAILNAPEPTNITEVKRFLGVVNYYRNFIPNASSIMSPLHELLRASARWEWGPRQRRAVRRVCAELASERVLAHFEPSAQLVLAVDAGPRGLGAVLSQRDSDGHERPLAFASRSLATSERNYSQIQKEATAIIFGVKHFHQYLYGRSEPFILKTDHRPLVSIFNNKTGISVTTALRLQRYAIILSAYNYTVQYISSENNLVADYFSRAPIPDVVCETDKGYDAYCSLNFLDATAPAVLFTDIKNATENDKTIQTVIKYTNVGWPRKIICASIRPYFFCRTDLQYEKGILMRGHKVVIPMALRERMLRELHNTHLGIVKMKCNARGRMWWPGIDEDIERWIGACDKCTSVRHAPPRATPAPWPSPAAPWERIHIDYLSIGQQTYLVVIDAYSKWLECIWMHNDVTTQSLIKKLKQIFSVFGIPSTLVSDNDVKINSKDFNNFCSNNGINYMTSPIYHPCSNGQAENSVRTCKKMLKIILSESLSVTLLQEKLIGYLFEYRNTIHCTTGHSPAKLMFGRELRSRLDLILPKECKPRETSQRTTECKMRDFKVGDRVWVRWYSGRKESWKLGVVNKVIGNRMFKIFIEEQNGFTLRHVDQLLHYRNRKCSHINPNEPEPSASHTVYSPMCSRVPLSPPVLPMPDNISEPNTVSTVVGAATEELVEGDGAAPTDTAAETSVEADRDQSAVTESVSREHARQTCSEVSEGQAPQASVVIQEPDTSPVSRARSERPRKKADIAHSAKGYESEDENAGRKWQRASDERPASKTTMYSKQEFREQYCINNKQLDLLELEKSKKDRFLGCLSQYHIESPCSRANRASFLSVCVRRRVPSDENLNTDYAPIQRYPRFGQPSPAPPELCAYDADLECSYFRRRPRSVCSQPDPKRYTWMPEDEDFTRMEWPQSVIEDNAGWPQNYNVDQIASVSRGGSLPRPPSIIPCPAHTPIPPPPPPPPLTIPPHRTKHVSFARSHTLTTFDDSVMPAAVSGNRFRRDCERLIDGRVVKPEPKPYSTLPVMFQPFPPYPQFMSQAPPAPIHYPPPITPHPVHPPPPIQRPTQTEQPKVVVLDSIKKGVMRTQATQTEVCLGRKPLPPNYLSLSPRTIKRVKMVAAGVQTNGYTVGVRRLTKSFSEVGGDRLAGRDSPSDIATTVESFITSDHEKLHRTQSEEPPRSPRSPTAMMIPSSPLQRGDSDDVTSSSVKSVASSSQIDKSSELSALQRQAQEYFQQNFQFIHESDRDDTIDDDIENIEKSMALNRRNLEFLQQEIAKQSKSDKSLRSILSKSTSDASQKTINSSHPPFSKTSTFQSEPSTETSATTTDDSEKNEKEIIIDFEPRPDDEAIPFTTLRRKNRRMLQKTLSEGEILLDVRKTELQSNGDGIKDAPIIMSTSQENMTREDREREALYTQYIGQNYSQTPIKDEGIFGFEPDGSFSSSDGNAPYEDFHEKYISYKHEPFRNRSVSFEEKTEIIVDKDEIPESSTARSSPGSPEPVTIEADVEPKVKRAVISNTVTTILTPLDKVSPCASNESLTVDQSRDHSDGLWNESQTTVLQVDSGTENGTVISSSDLSSLAASPGALALLTPTSRRKQLLLLQHQQRSSLDTDALDEEFDASQSQSPTSPRNKLDTSSSSSQARASLSPPAVVPNISLPITKQPTISKSISTIAPPKVNHTPAIAITHPSLDLADVPFKRTPSFINKKRERALSPSRRRDLQKKAQQKEPNGTIPNQIVESPSEQPIAKAASSETSLARTDSGKINTTDVSESTTTTEDYVTANSDSSKKSNSKIPNQNPENNKTQDGSSFESASSLYSSTRTENIAEDLIVPSFSPPLEINDNFIVPDLASPPLPLPDRLPRVSMEKIEVKVDITPTIEHIKREKTDIKLKDDIPKVSKTMRGTISGKSSSSGSYSIGGSNPNVTEANDDKTPTEKIPELPERSESKERKEDKSTATIHEKEQLVPKMMGSLSDDERSVHYSSSGYYESPVEDDDDGGLTYKHSQRYKSVTRPKSWLADEKRRKKKAFTLEFSKSYDDSVSTNSQDDWGKKVKDPDSISQKSERSIFKPSNVKSPQDEKAPEVRKKKTHFAEKTKCVQSSPREAVDIEKSLKEKTCKDKDSEPKRPAERERYVKRTKLKPKSPTQSKAVDGNNHSYRAAHYERRETIGSNMKLHLNIPTSDDSSEQYRKEGTNNGNISPRKHRRLRDSPRRKTANNSNNAKSPTTANNHTVYRPRRKSGSNESISLPGSLPRRKQSIPTVPHMSSLEAEDVETTRTLTSAGSRLTPLRYVKSPTTSPRNNRKPDKDGKFAKAASAESLRSVSPGSDSVFYSEQTEHSLVGADGESKAHCLHCGKEVHIVTAAHEHDSVASRTSHTDESYADATPDIVPAPAGFADSPSCATNKKHASGARLYKKLDKRYRSEDKSRHYYRSRQDVRAKSEERGKEEYATSEKPQDTRIARSAGNSLDKLGGSSASVDPDEHEECSGSSEGAEGARDEKGIYAAPWWCGNWIMLSENNDHWTRIPPDVLDTGSDAGQEDPTESESEFNKRYVALTHRLVHRRACIELNRRQADNSFVKDMINNKGSVRQKLEEILKLMLMLWCRQSQISRLVAPEPCESDKTVVVRRGNEEFGFRIHGSKPVVVSAIEPDTPAETSGLEVGDIVIAVNGINVLDKTHSEVVKIAHSGSEILELEVARTCEVVASLAHEGGPAALYSGYLWRAAPVRPHHPPRWTRRWFVLKRDNCLYYYKTDSSIHPVGALMLVNYQLTEEDAGRPHGFRLHRGGGVRLQLAADTSEAAARWRAVLAHAIDASNQRDGWLEVTMRNMKLPPSSIPRPDCFGYLMKLGSKWKSWAKRYCVLKDACLYFYNDGNSKNAFGMACLHGYRIQTCAPGGKKYAFEVMPTEPKQRHFYFHTESEMDRKRWMAALEYSIDRWMKAG